MTEFNAPSETEMGMRDFIQKFKKFDEVCYNHGFDVTSENIELFKAYIVDHGGD